MEVSIEEIKINIKTKNLSSQRREINPYKPILPHDSIKIKPLAVF